MISDSKPQTPTQNISKAYILPTTARPNSLIHTHCYSLEKASTWHPVNLHFVEVPGPQFTD